MFKIDSNNIPTLQATRAEMADYLEWRCLKSGCTFSLLKAAKNISMWGDSEKLSIETDDDRALEKLQEALNYIRFRKKGCGNKYPFMPDGDSLKCIDSDSPSSIIYKFLLLNTRLNGKIVIVNGAKYDGTLLFEQLSSIILKNYWGKDNSHVFVTGTSNRIKKFEEKIKIILEKLHYPLKLKRPLGSTGHEKDGGIDVVVWKNFSDNKDSKLFGLCQCKTGTQWINGNIAALSSRSFWTSYIEYSPFLHYIPIYMVTEDFENNWEVIARNAGLFFDRCRIMDYLPDNIDNTECYSQIVIWTDYVIKNN